MLIQMVASVNYLRQVAVLVDSLMKHNVSLEYSVLVTDATKELMRRLDGLLPGEIELLCCDDIGFKDIDVMRRYYSALEFNAACKMLAVRHQISERGVKEVLFLDADMYNLHGLDDLSELQGKDILLTHHTGLPCPDDDCLPTDLELVLVGHINAGFLYVKNSKESIAALNWLVSKVSCYWFISPRHGMHAEQQWLSAMPYFFSNIVGICSDLSINVAYWNLHERPLYEKDGTIMTMGMPVKLVHFSGFKPKSGGRFTLYTDREFDTGTMSVLGRLTEEYEIMLSVREKDFEGLKGDIRFCDAPLSSRMKTAEKIWGIEYFGVAESHGFFERLGKRIDGIMS